MPRISSHIRWITPYKKERLGTHPHSGGTAPHNLPIHGIELLKALC
jgi:hypothetical protein